ncbi:DUF6950 family protein [Tundrisphaera lichenicola]|uniref:DUF6950 family protein n=1 Tax=Tundrisphaera lichenicola TaxID=2029860 RepID=UPI003EBF96FD
MRPEGWEGLLAAHIVEGRSCEFEWGAHDCVLWCANWVRKLTGNDLAADWRGTYGTEEEANSVLNSLGFASPADLADEHLDAIPVLRAKRGDIVQHPAGMLGICDGARAYFLTLEGVTRLEFTKCLRAWKV